MAIEKRRQRRFVYSSLMFLFLLATETAASSWWLLGVSTVSEQPVDESSERVDCNNVIAPVNLTASLMAGCNKQSVNRVFRSLSVGTRNGIIQCQRSFNRSLWNCTTFNGENLFGSFTKNNTRETSIVNTLLTAGAALSIADDCRQELLRPGCTCSNDGKSRRVNNSQVFFDCNDDINFAGQFLREYLFNQNASTVNSLAENHNINVGLLLTNTRSQSCRCHGISGTCSLQTCYNKAPAIDKVGKMARSEYTVAVAVKLLNGLLSRKDGIATNIPDHIPVFTENSPNFCEENLPLGVTGTANRQCSFEPDQPDSCSVMCCQRPAYFTVETVYEKCCEFVWCCRLECKLCNPRNITRYFCT